MANTTRARCTVSRGITATMLKHLGEKLGSDGIRRLDQEMWDLIYALSKRHIVHFITDSKHYLNEAYRRYGEDIFYGLHWEDIKFIWNRYGERATNLSAAITNFAILARCTETWACRSSSLADWLQYQDTCTLKLFKTTEQVEWHHLTNKARNDISVACAAFYDNHLTSWHMMAKVCCSWVDPTRLAVIRRLTDDSLTSFLELLREYGIGPNTGFVKLHVIAHWIRNAEKSARLHMQRVFDNRASFLQIPDASDAEWLNLLLRIKLFDYLVAKYDVLSAS